MVGLDFKSSSLKVKYHQNFILSASVFNFGLIFLYFIPKRFYSTFGEECITHGCADDTSIFCHSQSVINVQITM